MAFEGMWQVATGVRFTRCFFSVLAGRLVGSIWLVAQVVDEGVGFGFVWGPGETKWPELWEACGRGDRWSVGLGL